MSTPRVPRDCYLYLWYLCARYVSLALAPISCMMHNIRVVLMRGEAGLVAVISYNNNIYYLDQKPCIEDLFMWNGCHVYRGGSSPYPVTRNLCNGQLPMMGGTVVRGMYA